MFSLLQVLTMLIQLSSIPADLLRMRKQESIDAIMEAVGKKNRGELKKIVVMGCLSERFKKELAAEIPEVDSFFGTNQLRDVLKDLSVDYKSELLGERFLTTPSHYAYLKISEGCDNPCSFCAIPLDAWTAQKQTD